MERRLTVATVVDKGCASHVTLFKGAKRGKPDSNPAVYSFVCAFIIAPPTLLAVSDAPLAVRCITCRRGLATLELHEQRQPDHNPGARRAGHPHAPLRHTTLHLETESVW